MYLYMYHITHCKSVHTIITFWIVTKEHKVREKILPNGASAHVSDERHGGGDVVGDDASAKTVVGVVGAVHDLVEGLELEDALDGPEDLRRDWGEDQELISKEEENGG